jgi:hypothetical protein
MVVNVGQGCIPAFHFKCYLSFAGFQQKPAFHFQQETAFHFKCYRGISRSISGCHLPWQQRQQP